MKRVELITRYAGPSGNFPPGSVIRVSDEEAEALVGGRYARYTDRQARTPAVEVETADMPDDEEQAAVSRPSRSRTRQPVEDE